MAKMKSLTAVLVGESEDLENSLESVTRDTAKATRGLEAVDEALEDIAASGQAAAEGLGEVSGELVELGSSGAISQESIDKIGNELEQMNDKMQVAIGALGVIAGSLEGTAGAAQGLSSELDDVGDEASNAAADMFGLSGANLEEAVAAEIAESANNNLARANDNVADEADDATRSMFAMSGAAEALSLSSSALSINVGFMTVALRNLTTQVPLLITSLGTLATAFVGVASAAGLAAGGVGSVLGAGFLAEAQALSEEMGENVSTLEAMQEIGKEVKRMMNEAIQPLLEAEGVVKAFRNAMEGLATTVNMFSGAIAASFSNAEEEFFTIAEFMDIVGDAWMNNLRDVTEGMMTLWTNLGPIFADMLVFVIEKFDEFATFVSTVTRQVAKVFGEGGEGMADFIAGLIKLGIKVASGIAPIMQGFISVITGVTEALNGMQDGTIGTVVKLVGLLMVINKLAGALGAFIAPMSAAIASLFRGAIAADSFSGAIVRTTGNFLKFLKAHVSGFAALSKALSVFLPHTEEGISTISRFGKAIKTQGGLASVMANKLGLASLKVRLFGESASASAASMDNTTGALHTFGSAVGRVADTMAGKLLPNFLMMQQMTSKNTGMKIAGQFERADTATAGLSATFGRAKKKLLTYANTIVGAVVPNTLLMSGTMGSVAGSIGNVWDSAIDGIINKTFSFQNTFNKAINHIDNNANNTMQAIGETIIVSVEKAGKKIADFGLRGVKAFGRMRDGAGRLSSAITGSIIKGIVTVQNSVTDLRTSFANARSGVMDSLGNIRDGITKRVVGGLVRAQTAAWNFQSAIAAAGRLAVAPLSAVKGEVLNVANAFRSSKGVGRSFANAILTSVGNIQIRDRMRGDMDMSFMKGDELFGDIKASNIALAARQKWIDPIGRQFGKLGSVAGKAVKSVREGAFSSAISGLRSFSDAIGQGALKLEMFKVANIKSAISNRIFNSSIAKSIKASKTLTAIRTVLGNVTSGLTAKILALTGAEAGDTAVKTALNVVSALLASTWTGLAAIGSTLLGIISTLAIGAGALVAALGVLVVVGGTVALMLAKLGSEGKSAESIISGLMDKLRTLGDAIMPLVVASANMMQDIFAAIAAPIKQLVDGFKDIAVELGLVEEGIGEGQSKFESFMAVINKAVAFINPILNKIGELSKVLGNILANAIKDGMEAFVQFLDKVDAQGKLQQVMAVIKQLAGRIIGFKDDIMGLVDTLKSGFMATLGVLIDQVTSIMDTFKEAFGFGGGGGDGGGGGIFSTVLNVVQGYYNSLLDIVGPAINLIESLAAALFGWVQTIMKVVGGGIELLIKAIAGLMDFVDQLLGVFGFSLAGIFSGAISAVQKVIGFIGPLINMIAGIIDVAAIVGDMLFKNFAAVASIIGAVLAPAFDLVGNAIMTIAKIVKLVMDVVIGTITGAIDFVIGYFETLVESIKMLLSGNLKGAVMNIVDFFVSSFQKVFKFIKSIFGRIGGIITSAIGNALNIVGDMLTNLPGVFMDAFGQIGSSIASVFAEPWNEHIAGDLSFEVPHADKIPGVPSTVGITIPEIGTPSGGGGGAGGGGRDASPPGRSPGGDAQEDLVADPDDVSEDDILSGGGVATDVAGEAAQRAGLAGQTGDFNYEENNVTNNKTEVDARPEDKGTIGRVVKDAMEEANSFERRREGHTGG